MNEEARLARRQQILAGARACFVQRGFHASSVSEIAAAAGVSNANIYQYFENKEALIIALIEEEVRHDLALVHKLSGSKLQGEELRAVMSPLFLTDEGRDRAILRCEISSEATRNAAAGELLARSNDRTIEAMARGVRVSQTSGNVSGAVDADRAAELLAFVFDGLFMQRSLPGIDGEALLAALVDHFANILHPTR
ncbi:TetR/AcrR family transcriptional regulator [Novosphingobium sp.]|uniref:TetR/AcrR family transcriptional regulator n=1 Tax=Novosphingobium sp. TaxID=1874826 RepID=UPI00260AF8F0|nr:TetR/AcrR family transcriptional regulator [Novosphingobium sp.]